MKKNSVFRVGVGLALLIGGGLTVQTARAEPVGLGSAFTYQGQLLDGGAPANDPYDFEFRLLDSDGNLAGTPNPFLANNVSVANGLFTVQLTFENAFNGDERYLEIGVRPGSSAGPYTTLAPHQRLTAAPYALYALTAGSVPWNFVTDKPTGFGDGVDDDHQYTAGTGLTLSGDRFNVNTTVIQRRVTGACPLGSSIQFINDDGTVGCQTDDNSGGTVTSITAGTGLSGGSITRSGTIAVNFGSGAGTVAEGNHNHDTAYWSLDGNSTGVGDFLGTLSNQPLDFRANNARALRLEPAMDALGASSPNFVGGNSNNRVKPGAYGATIGGGGSTTLFNRVTDNYGTIAGGQFNQAGDDAGTESDKSDATVAGGQRNVASGQSSAVGGGRNNTASGQYAVVAGGYDNEAAADYATVAGGGRSNSNDAATGNRATDRYGAVGGGGNNQAGNGAADPSDAIYATVGGGRGNSASDSFATVGGGDANVATDTWATVGGGHINNASDMASTVGGGDFNVASGEFSTISGGEFNAANGSMATIGGGANNSAGGTLATVPGGSNNSAAGNFSFAAGNRAKANAVGCFVWADSTDTDLNCGTNNRFIVRASGGIWLGSSSTVSIPAGRFINTSTGGYLSTGGDWINNCDRAQKTNFAPVEGRDIVVRLAATPIQTWNYKSQDPSVRHIGPVAQDFAAAFRIGADDTHISTVDADGVALAAIQGLYEIVQEKDAKLAALEVRLAALEAAVRTISPPAGPR